MSNVPKSVRRYMSALGRRGRGKSKRRGDSGYYRGLALRRWKRAAPKS